MFIFIDNQYEVLQNLDKDSFARVKNQINNKISSE